MINLQGLRRRYAYGLGRPGIYGCVFADTKLWIERLFQQPHDLCWRKRQSTSDIIEEIHLHRADPTVDIDYIGQRLNGLYFFGFAHSAGYARQILPERRHLVDFGICSHADVC